MPPVPSVVTAARAQGRREAVTDQIRAAILTGTFLPDEVVRETELATWLGVSVTPVREALSRLAGEGLVDIEANGPRRIARLDRAGAVCVIDVFQALALTGITWAVARIDDEELRQIRAVSDEYVDALRRGDVDAGALGLDRFWELLFAAAKNPELDTVMRTLRARIVRVLRLYAPLENPSVYADDHLRNLADIEARDINAVISRFGGTMAFLRDYIAKGEDKPWDEAAAPA